MGDCELVILVCFVPRYSLILNPSPGGRQNCSLLPPGEGLGMRVTPRKLRPLAEPIPMGLSWHALPRAALGLARGRVVPGTYYGKAGTMASYPPEVASGWRWVTRVRISSARDMGRSSINNTFPCSMACSNIFKREFGTCIATMLETQTPNITPT